MLEFRQTINIRKQWPRDLLIGSVAVLWLFIFSSFELPFFISMTGIPVVLVFGAWLWSPVRAALFVLIFSWVYAKLSLVPSGSFWVAGFLSYLALKLARFRFLIRSLFQLSLTVFLTSLLFDGIQTFLFAAVHELTIVSWALILRILLSAVLHALLGAILYPVFSYWVREG